MRAWALAGAGATSATGTTVYAPGYVETEYRADYQTDVFTVDAAGGKLIWTGITRSVDLSSTQRTTDEISPRAGAGTDQTGHSERKSQVKLVDRIDALLPQTQCTRCGYDGCRPYAQALADDLTAINRCPPVAARNRGAGGAAWRALIPLDPACGSEADAAWPGSTSKRASAAHAACRHAR